MKKITLIACLAFAFLSGITPSIQDGKYCISGVIDRAFDGQRAILYVRNDAQDVIRTDTSVIKQGEFSFVGDEYTDNLSCIKIKDRFGVEAKSLYYLLLESGDLSVSFTNDQPYVKGTPLNDILMKHVDSTNHFALLRKDIDPGWGPDGMFIDPTSKLGQLFYEEGEYRINFIRQNFSNPIGRALLMLIVQKDAINIPTHLYSCENANSIDDLFAFVDPQSTAYPYVASYISRIIKVRTSYPLIGEKIDNFTLLTPDGNTKQLSDYIGDKDYLFLEFWASWCSPCLAAIPGLTKIHNKYSDRLNVVSISLDTKNDAWIDALKTQNMPWPQLADLNGYNSDIAKKFIIKGIPFGVLIDKNGVIVNTVSNRSVEQYMQEESNCE